MWSTGIIGFDDDVRYEPPHRPKMLGLALVGKVIVAAEDVEHKLGVDDLRDGATLCAGVLYSSKPFGNTVLYNLRM